MASRESFCSCALVRVVDQDTVALVGVLQQAAQVAIQDHVDFMKLSRPDGLELDQTAADYADSVMTTGEQVEENMMAFLGTRGVKCKYGSELLKKLVELHRSRTFEDLVSAYHTRIAVGRVVDPAPDAEKVVF